MSDNVIVSLQSVSKVYQEGQIRVRAVNELSLEIRKGDFAALSGPSGSGKTTVLNLIGGLDVPSGGTVLLEGRDLAAMSRVWGSDDIICIHPGATPLLGREAVLDSWSRILGGGSSPRIRITLRSSKASADLAVHLVEEFISDHAAAEGAIVLATNVYIRRGSGWYLFEHHASSPRVRRARGGSGPAGRSKQTLQ